MDIKSSKLEIAIVGGGIAGLLCAIALTQPADPKLSVRVYESTHQFQEIGAGVSVFRRPLQALKRLGLEESLNVIADIPDEEDELRIINVNRISSQPEPAKETDKFLLSVPCGSVGLYRVEFQKILARHLKQNAVDVEFGRRLERYTLEKDDKVKLHFTDGRTATCDVLIGADGTHSRIRHTLYENVAHELRLRGEWEKARQLMMVKEPVYAGVMAYRFLIPNENLERLNPHHEALTRAQNYAGRDRHIVTYPLPFKGVVNVLVLVANADKEGMPWVDIRAEERTQAELLSHFVGWEPEVQQICQCVDRPKVWAVNMLEGLPFYVNGSVALIGDSAHSMNPNQGSGAGQSMEDAYVLGALLKHPLVNRQTVATALKVYEQVRLPHANHVMRVSRENGRLWDFTDEYQELFKGVNRESGELIKRVVDLGAKKWEWAWTTDVDDDKNEAFRLFENALKGGETRSSLPSQRSHL